MAKERSQAEFVLAAHIVGELGEVTRIAREMTLEVCNAKAVATRAGEQARGFQPITDFIEESAFDIMRQVKEIHREAMRVSQSAVAKYRTQDAITRYQRAKEKAEEAEHTEGAAHIEVAMADVRQSMRETSAELVSQVKVLGQRMEDIAKHVRSVNVIAVSSRVEASRAAEYRQSLEGVADNLEAASTAMRTCVSASQSWLEVFSQEEATR